MTALGASQLFNASMQQICEVAQFAVVSLDAIFIPCAAGAPTDAAVVALFSPQQWSILAYNSQCPGCISIAVDSITGTVWAVCSAAGNVVTVRPHNSVTTLLECIQPSAITFDDVGRILYVSCLSPGVIAVDVATGIQSTLLGVDKCVDPHQVVIQSGELTNLHVVMESEIRATDNLSCPAGGGRYYTGGTCLPSAACARDMLLIT